MPNPHKIGHKDLNNLRIAVEFTYGHSAEVTAIWAHGDDPLALTYFAVVDTQDGTGTPFVPVSAVYSPYGVNVVAGTDATPGGLVMTPGAAVAHEYLAVTALVTDDNSIAP